MNVLTKMGKSELPVKMKYLIAAGFITRPEHEING